MNRMHVVPVFFYGTYMSASVLADYGVHCESTELVRLDDYRLVISPRVNLEPYEGVASYGGFVQLPHDSIKILYDRLDEQVGLRYLPTPVIVNNKNDRCLPAITYVHNNSMGSPATREYIDQMVDCANELGAPTSYIEHIESF